MTFKPKTTEEQQYICIRMDGLPPFLIGNQEQLIKAFNSSDAKDTDRYYVLGSEVKVQTTVVPATGTTYREGSYREGTR